MNVIDWIIEFIWYPFRMLYLVTTFWMFYWGSRKEKKWVLKNQRYQDNDYNPFSKRWEYAIGKINGLALKLGISVDIKGQENIKKGGQIIVANHTSYADSIALAKLLGTDFPSTAVGKIELEKTKLKGYTMGLEVFLIDRNNLRQSAASLMGSGRWAKENNRPVIIFPEGQRSTTGELLKFNDATFSMAKKLLLPITPVTIIGARSAMKKWYLPGPKKITVIVEEPIKSKDIRHKDAILFAKDVQEKIQKNLDK